MRRVMIVMTVIALAAGAARPVAAQDEEPRRGGFWVSLGLGAGVQASGSDNPWGGAGYFRLAGVPDEQVVFGTEALGWVTEDNDVYTGRGVWTLFVQFYPSKRGGFFLKGGLGGGGLSVWVDQGSSTVTNTTGGFGMTWGAGYEIRLSNVTSFTANADWMFTAVDDQAGGTAEASVFLFTIGLTFPKIGD